MDLPLVNAWTEWGDLEEVVVGRADGARYYAAEPGWMDLSELGCVTLYVVVCSVPRMQPRARLHGTLQVPLRPALSPAADQGGQRAAGPDGQHSRGGVYTSATHGARR